MCGIAGVLYDDPSRPPDRMVLEAMGAAIAHRGPDADGFLAEPGIGMVHRRLAIIDLDGGNQPIGNEDGSLQVVFNGEIYNYRELRDGLEVRGHRFRTSSDTEVLVHLYEELGEPLVERLRGMFAFALWDRGNRRLLLARDRLGIKPLYVSRRPDALIFGSEPKAILAHPGVGREVDVEALEDYLAFGMVPGRRSIFRGIEKLPPAHTILASPGRRAHQARRYWRLRMEPDHTPTAEQWAEAIRDKVDETTRMHLIADVPVGAFLSGGLDSGVMVASCAGQVSGPLRTFSIGFDEPGFDELPAARRVAGLYGTHHIEEVVTPDAAGLLGEMVRFYDEPFADPSAIPTYLVSRLASRSVKVTISGDGGDEAFGGYRRYAHDLKEATLRRLLPGWIRRTILGPLAQAWPKSDRLPRSMRAKTLLTNLALDDAAAYANTISICRQPLRRRLMDPDLASRLDGHEPERIVREGYASVGPSDPLGGMIAADVDVLLPDDFLVKVDRASMAHGLEVRPPLLDHELLEMAARIPSRWKVRGGRTKWIFKTAYRDKLPASTIWGPKHGFDLPIDGWLRGPLHEMFEDVVLSSRGRIAGLVDQSVARSLDRAHRSKTGRHGATLWSLLILAVWAEEYLRTPSTVASE